MNAAAISKAEDPGPPSDDQRWSDACLSAVLLALDPAGLRGATLRGLPEPSRTSWIAVYETATAPNAPLRRIPSAVEDDRLLGGLDLTATLHAGKPVTQRGILAEADGGTIIQSMAERVSQGQAARIAAALDTGRVTLARDGVHQDLAADFALILLDEGLEPDERPPVALLDRVAFHIELSHLRPVDDISALMPTHQDLDAARAILAKTSAPDDVIEALCSTALALGIVSPRVAQFAVRAAKAVAALDERVLATMEDAAVAARLVLAPRATRLPLQGDDSVPEEDDNFDPPPEPEQQDQPDDPLQDQAEDNRNDAPLPSELLVAATVAALPSGLLERLESGAQQQRNSTGGKAGQVKKSRKRGRPIGARPGMPGSGNRLHLLQTLRTAAPWQKIRRAERAAAGLPPKRIDVRRDDFRIRHFKERSETTTIFVVDASGSAALSRLAEAKGAVELLLADCYARRDSVALITFSGKKVDLALPPTRSLVRAKRQLAALPGGGGTPIASALDAAAMLCDLSLRKGQTPVVVLLTDGKANLARDGSTGKVSAEEDAIAAARELGALGIKGVYIDIAPRTRPFSTQLAGAMQARYLALPHADAHRMNNAVRSSLSVAPGTATQRS